MSEQKERWQVQQVSSSLADVLDEKGLIVARCGRINAARDAEQIVQDHNACLSLPTPDADVRALVEALERVCKELESTLISEFETRNNPHPELGNEPLQTAKSLLTRLRREP